MSSLTVLCPNGHRVKVSTNPNMSLQAVLDFAANKKGFDPATHVLEFHKKRIDLSSSVRFSGLPNNATVEMEQLSEEEISRLSSQQVSVCLQLPDGARLMDNFPVSSSLGSVLDHWQEKLGSGEEGEEPVMVYMRREVVGRREMDKVTLRTLGLVQGKGLFRFFFKKPEQLRVQANVYDMKEKEKSEPKELPHIPMRLAPDNTKEPEPNNEQKEESPMEVAVEPKPSTSTPDVTRLDTKSVESEVLLTASKENEIESKSMVQPDSTQPEPIIHFVGPSNAIVFSAEDGSSKYQDIDDDFFELSLDEVKSMYKDLKMEVKRLTEGEMMQTKEMRESQKEVQKVQLLSKYNSSVIRIQFSSRHVVQGIFSPDTKISEVLTWLSPYLSSPGPDDQELYTAPPRTPLSPSASLFDLGLFPAALIHYTGPSLSDETLSNLSNISGANSVAGQARRQLGKTRNTSDNDTETEDKFLIPDPPSSRLRKRSNEDYHYNSTNASSNEERKVPKWFKPGKK